MLQSKPRLFRRVHAHAQKCWGWGLFSRAAHAYAFTPAQVLKLEKARKVSIKSRARRVFVEQKSEGKMYLFCHWINLLNLLLLAVFPGLAEPRRPLVRAPRDAQLTGEHLIVADKSLSSEKFHQLLARISMPSNGATVRGYVENVGKVITATLSPYAKEMVRLAVFALLFPRIAIWQGISVNGLCGEPICICNEFLAIGWRLMNSRHFSPDTVMNHC